MVLAFVLAVILIVFVLAPIARAHADRLGRGGDPGLPGAPQEMARLREEVDRLGAEVARLTEEQAFMLRLLGSGAPPSPPAGGESGRPDDTRAPA